MFAFLILGTGNGKTTRKQFTMKIPTKGGHGSGVGRVELVRDVSYVLFVICCRSIIDFGNFRAILKSASQYATCA